MKSKALATIIPLVVALAMAMVIAIAMTVVIAIDIAYATAMAMAMALAKATSLYELYNVCTLTQVGEYRKIPAFGLKSCLGNSHRI